MDMARLLLQFSFSVAIVCGAFCRADAEPAIAWSVRLDNKFVHKNHRAVHALVRLDARQSQDDERSQPLNLALVVDRSGSMRGQKIEDARRAALEMVERMRDGDRVSLVSYSTDVRVDVGNTRLTSETRREVNAAIHRLVASGNTNLSGGLTEGHKQVDQFLKDDTSNRVLLISDGLANLGITDVKELNRIAREVFQKGIMTTTIGVGADYNEDLMTAVADHGGGNYYFLKDSSEIAAALNREVRQMMATVAKQVSIAIEVAGGAKVERVHGWLTMDDGKTKIVRLSELFAGQSRSVLCELSLPTPSGDLPQKVTLGKMTLHYKPVGKTAKDEVLESHPLQITVTDDEKAISENIDLEVSARITEIQLATQMQDAADLVRSGRYEEARKLLRATAVAAQAKSAALGPHGADLAKVAEQAEQLSTGVDDAEASPSAARLLQKGAKARVYQLRKK
jgi:Ca-activated chloride channel family protein